MSTDIFTRNPSEYERLVTERSEFLSTYAESKNKLADIAYHIEKQNIKKTQRLKVLYGLVWGGNRLSKKDKSVMLNEVRELEDELGLDNRPYNGYNGS